VLSLCLSRRGTPSSRSPAYGLATVDTDLPIVGRLWSFPRLCQCVARSLQRAIQRAVLDIRGVYQRRLWSCHPLSRSAVQVALAAAVTVVVVTGRA
jgi:hypothetical protein